MKFLDKKFIILISILFLIISISIYYFTKDTGNEFESLNSINISEVPISTNETTLIIIHISGEVQYPGIVSLPDGARISDAIAAAGSVTALADISKVNLAYKLKDGQKIYIPSIYDENDISYIVNDAGNNILITDTTSYEKNIININSANITELETLPRNR